MSLFDIFSFKKQAAKVFTAENFKNILETAREAIIKQIKNNIPGVEKKVAVDIAVEDAIRDKAKDCSNKIVQWILERIIAIVPTVTQLVYNYLKEKVENL